MWTNWFPIFNDILAVCTNTLLYYKNIHFLFITATLQGPPVRQLGFPSHYILNSTAFCSSFTSHCWLTYKLSSFFESFRSQLTMITCAKVFIHRQLLWLHDDSLRTSTVSDHAQIMNHRQFYLVPYPLASEQHLRVQGTKQLRNMYLHPHHETNDTKT